MAFPTRRQRKTVADVMEDTYDRERVYGHTRAPTRIALQDALRPFGVCPYECWWEFYGDTGEFCIAGWDLR